MKKINLILAFLSISTFLIAQVAPVFQVEVVGEKEEHIILIPGFSCSGEVWEETVELLKGTHTCHVLTFAGFADAPKSDEASWGVWRDAVADYIVEKKLGPTDLIGHSLGGMMALDLASSFPNLIRSITVVDALPALSTMQNPAFESKENLDCSNSVEMMVNQSTEQFEMMQRSSVAYMSSNMEKHDRIVSWALQSDRATLGQLFCELSNLDLREKLAQIKCPALILLEAPFKPMESVIAAQYEKLENAELAFAPKGLHFVMYDAPEWYAKQLSNQFQVK